MKTFGMVIREQREKQGYNQRQFAELIGVTPTRLNYWEKDKREPDVPNIKKILRGLDITFEELASMTEVSEQAPVDETSLQLDEYPVMAKYRRLNDSGKEYIDAQLDFALSQDKYCIKEKRPPHIPDMAAIREEAEAYVNQLKNQNVPTKK